MMESVPDLDIARRRKLQRMYWNAFKHMTKRDGEARNDDETLASFNDTKTDAALFVGCSQ